MGYLSRLSKKYDALNECLSNHVRLTQFWHLFTVYKNRNITDFKYTNCQSGGEKKGNDGKLEINITQSNKVSIASSVAEQSIEHIFSNINMYNLTKALNHYMCSIILNLFKVTKGNNWADFNLELTSSMRRINNKW